MLNAVIRKASINDANAVKSLTRKAFLDYARSIGQKNNVAALNETIDDIKKDIEQKEVYLCEIDNIAIGAVRFELLGSQTAYLSRLAVHPRYQSFGVGKLLIEKVKQECCALNVSAIALHTAACMPSVVALYEKNGYFVHSVTCARGYLRALMINEINKTNTPVDYESVVAGR